MTTAPEKSSPANAADFSTARLEAFSDGVFSIAITLLVLDLAVPSSASLHDQTLAHALARQWPSYLAYLVSFLVIGIIWINHHAMCALARRVDRITLFANLFLLLTVSVIPFPTRLLATYLTASPAGDAHTAAAVYSATMLAMGIAFTLLFLAFTRDARRLHSPVPPEALRSALRRFATGGLCYAGTISLAYLSPVAMLVVHAALAVYYCFDQLAPARSGRNSPARSGGGRLRGSTRPAPNAYEEPDGRMDVDHGAFQHVPASTVQGEAERADHEDPSEQTRALLDEAEHVLKSGPDLDEDQSPADGAECPAPDAGSDARSRDSKGA